MTRPEDDTTEARRMAREIEASLRARGVATATVRAKATKPGQAGHLEIGGVPCSQMNALCRAICDGETGGVAGEWWVRCRRGSGALPRGARGFATLAKVMTGNVAG